MFEWLFPGWSNPAALTALVGVRFLCNAALTGVVARSVGRASPLTVAVGAATLGSAAMTVLLLRPGALGYRASLVELLVQAALVVAAGYAVSASPSAPRVVAAAVAALGAVGLLVVSIPVYGEAFVAP